MKDFIKFLGSRTFLINLGLAAVSVVLLTILAMQWLRSSTNHGEHVEVPDLSKLSVTDMRKKIEEAGLRYEVMDSANFNPDYPRFSIIEQTPKGGSKVKENRKIYVTVNPSGYKQVSVPNIIQVTQRNAESMLRAVGLEVERVTYIDQLGKNMVYYIRHKGKQVKPGDKLPKKSEIELVCGNGTIPGSAQVQSDSE
ncbi:PASTA domain-containing protein [Zeaxanthinibacter sp. PT1]|uniref:PASTA domain-containing protein n=1 Tax=Zeaxanthinibacter TaxID=561554 RepID=UPI0023493781|nr:PASTA domain-containing protein [Zeaxanthinibacter sp. PT1]MDC6351822.1 PASTA domain-containing protein [Zeaxanthinibacter sp. PT1]